jgi:hypothetical protein
VSIGLDSVLIGKLTGRVVEAALEAKGGEGESSFFVESEVPEEGEGSDGGRLIGFANSIDEGPVAEEKDSSHQVVDGVVASRLVDEGLSQDHLVLLGQVGVVVNLLEKLALRVGLSAELLSFSLEHMSPLDSSMGVVDGSEAGGLPHSSEGLSLVVGGVFDVDLGESLDRVVVCGVLQSGHLV